MPGIVGIIGNDDADHSQRLVELMLDSMEHEPFYRSASYSEPDMGIYLGAVTLDASIEDQIYFNEGKDVALVLNGECFFDSSTGDKIRRKGHQLGKTHASWLTHLYEEEGEQFIKSLNGLFSGLLIDRKQRKAILFNDRYGSERVYWHRSRGTTYFASEAKALLRILPELRGFDSHGVAQFLAYGCTYDARTLFRDIQLLPGASLWVFNDSQCQKKLYFSPETWESQSALSADDFEARFQEIFKSVLPRYFKSQTEIGISLTGGLDTRMIMACRPETARKPICYTFSGLKGLTLDDRIAIRVANSCGLEHRLLRLGADFLSDFASDADRTIYVTDGAFGIIGAHEIYLNRQARELAPLRLTGLYGSEIVRGMSTFKPLRLAPSLVSPEFSESINESSGEGIHPITSAAFRNVPWNLFGSAAASRSEVVLRTPYLDNEIVALAFRAPEAVTRSPRASLRVVENNSLQLRRIPTDRRIEDKEGGLVSKLRRSFFEASFKLDYFHNEGMPSWFLPYDHLFERINSTFRMFGHHKFLHYRSWFRRELADYIEDGIGNAKTQGAPFWNSDFLERLARDHIEGRKNYVLEINAVLTLEAVQRLLFSSFPKQDSRRPGISALSPTAVK